MPEDLETETPLRTVTRSPGYNELGRTGLKHFSGTIFEEWLPQLQGDRGVKIYTEMRDNSPVIGSMLFAIEHLLRSVDWYVEANSDAPSDEEAADFIDSCMHDMTHTWEDFISEALSFLPYGWSYFEIVFKKRNGRKRRTPANRLRTSKHSDSRIGWGRFGFRAQETLYRWEIDNTGDIHGMWQYPTPSTPFDDKDSQTVLIPVTKALHFRTTSFKNNPEGRSILRNAYHPWFFAKRIEQIEAIGIERDLAGMPIARVPIEILALDRTAEETATYNYVKDVVTKVKRDQQEGIIWPLAYDEEGHELYQFDLINAEGKRSFDTGGIIQRYQQQMVMTALADFILLGHENVGSFALSSDKTELFAVALGSWLDQISEVLNRDAVIPLLELNGFDVENPPKICHGDIEDPDLQLLGDFIQKMAAAGAPMFPDLGLEEFIRDAAGMPPIDEEAREEILNQMQPAGLMPGMAGGAAAGEEDPGADPSQSPQKPPTASQPGEEADPVVKSANLNASYYNGSDWKTVRSRNNFRGRKRRR